MPDEPVEEITAKSFYKKFLFKTALRSILWFVITYMVVQQWPHLSWLWYVVIAFISIGIIISLMALVASKYESKDLSD